MLICKYTDPPLTQKEQQELQQKKNNNEPYTEPLSDFDITNFVTNGRGAATASRRHENLSLKLFIIP